MSACRVQGFPALEHRSFGSKPGSRAEAQRAKAERVWEAQRAQVLRAPRLVSFGIQSREARTLQTSEAN